MDTLEQIKQNAAGMKTQNFSNTLCPQELHDLICRVTSSQAYASAFEFLHIPRTDGKDGFSICDAKNNKIQIAASSGVAACSAIAWYLREKCGCCIGPLTRRITLPPVPPPVGSPYETLSPFLYRYFFNFCTFGYTMAFWTGKDFEKLTDWLLLSGVNLILNPVGHENVWYRLLRQKGYSDSQAKNFLCDPAHLPWQWMGNMSGYDLPLSDEWLEEQRALSQKISRKMRAFGAEIVLPGYCGFVPPDFLDHFPDAKLLSQGEWFGFQRPAILDYTHPLFMDMAHSFYDISQDLFGKCAYYSIDPFHEGGITQGFNVEAYGATVFSAMEYANPHAVWFLQGWGDNPQRPMLRSIPAEHLLIANLLSDKNFNAGDDFANTPWLYCTVNNFGGTRNLSGNLTASLYDPFRIADQNPENAMVGIGMLPEAITIDEIFFDVFQTISFAKSKPMLSDYLSDYAMRRYGCQAPHAAQALSILGKYIYMEGGIDSPLESVLCARPSLEVSSVSTWGGQHPTYDNKYLYQAARLLLEDYELCKQSDGFCLTL